MLIYALRHQLLREIREVPIQAIAPLDEFLGGKTVKVRGVLSDLKELF